MSVGAAVVYTSPDRTLELPRNKALGNLNITTCEEKLQGFLSLCHWQISSWESSWFYCCCFNIIILFWYSLLFQCTWQLFLIICLHPMYSHHHPPSLPKPPLALKTCFTLLRYSNLRFNILHWNHVCKALLIVGTANMITWYVSASCGHPVCVRHHSVIVDFTKGWGLTPQEMVCCLRSLRFWHKDQS